MAQQTIIIAPDPRLRRISKPVDKVDDALRRLMDDMLETMYAAPGIGLSAIQIGVAKRVIVIDLAKEGEVKKPVHLVNPELLWASEEKKVSLEGCLSLPDQFAEIERPAKIRVRHLDYHGEMRETAADDMLALCIQHEMDHLEGILFVDRLSSLKRDMILRKLQKAKRLQAKVTA
jgi:peptide deformylase